MGGTIHPHTELQLVNDVVGYGVFATRRIPRGTLTWARCALDRAFTVAEAEALPPLYRPILEKYAYIDGDAGLVLCWDHARFMNHSCAPACLSPGFDFDLAVRDIDAGEELTCDYGTLNLRAQFDCACARPGCRRTIGDDWTTLLATWDASVQAVFPAILRVAQPLAELVPEWAAVERAARGEVPIPSCARHRANSRRAPSA